MFSQIRKLSKALPVRNPIVTNKEVKQEITELKVPDGSFKGENIRIAGRRLIFLTLQQCLALDNDIICFDISYENDLLVSCTENILFIWNLKTMEIEQKIEIKLRNKRGEKEYIKITSCAISKDGKYIITIMPSKMIIWNKNTGKVSMILEIPVETHYIKFSDNNGEYLYASGEDGIVRAWDWKAGKQISLKLYHPASVRTFDFTHSNPVRFLCGRVDGYCTAWDFERKEIIDNIIPEPTWDAMKKEVNRGGWINLESNHTGSILSLKISPNKRLLATGSADFTCKLWNIASYGKDTETVKQDRLKENIDFNNLIDITLPYDIDGFGIRIGEVPFTTGFHADIMFTYRHEAPVTIVEFNSTSDILYTGSIDSTCRLWSTRKGELIFQINLPAQPQSLIVTPGLPNDMLYVTCQNRLLVFDVKAPTQEKDLPVYWRAGQELDSDNYFFSSKYNGNENIDINEKIDFEESENAKKNNNKTNMEEYENKKEENDKNKKLYIGESEKTKLPFEVDENGNEIDKNDVSNINTHKGKYTFEEVRKLLSHGLIRDSYIQTMIDELDINLPSEIFFSNIRKFNISLTQVLRSIINDQYKPIDVIKALFTKNNRIIKEFANKIKKGDSIESVMKILGFKKTAKEELDNTYIYLKNDDIRPITTSELKDIIKNDVFKFAFNKMFNNLSPDTIINDENMIHDVLHFIPSKQIKLIKDYQNNELTSKVFMKDLDPIKSLPARYPNFKRNDKKYSSKSIEPTSQNIGRVKRFDENRVKGKPSQPKEPEPSTSLSEESLKINTNKYMPAIKLGSLTKEQRKVYKN
ncbi:WD40 repeat-like protein [Piromyces finnis]|uniref:WD40 repeat-like protein n=1 Tax=Piromyces finnis TaxID=1754191 RepID=A0A1Y1VHB7_9FUNG|nr:WD40 repeat-like protein [Piromyces finnis]|eukprot:ORX56127.1 WD40 repeat-like protein [Piromyces finnis]